MKTPKRRRHRAWASRRPAARRTSHTTVGVDTTKEESGLKALVGLLHGWHGVYVRFGTNTVLTYWDKDKEAPDVVLRNNDIFYIDIGPVWEKWEGDGGSTFVIGNDPEMHRARASVRQVFDRVHEKWRTDALTGAALYEYASGVARLLGWELAPGVDGHRLGDFPHTAFHSGTLAGTAFTPATGLWVLEIRWTRTRERKPDNAANLPG